MTIRLQPRTEASVRVYFGKAQHPAIRRMLPQKAKTVEEALADYAGTQAPDAKSYGRTIHADDRYVGDVWIYCINLTDTPNAMLSFCIFEQDLRGRGVATEAVRLFMQEVGSRYGLSSIGAFTYAENAASIRVLEKNGFLLEDEFTEKDVVSRYYQATL